MYTGFAIEFIEQTQLNSLSHFREYREVCSRAIIGRSKRIGIARPNFHCKLWLRGHEWCVRLVMALPTVLIPSTTYRAQASARLWLLWLNTVSANALTMERTGNRIVAPILT